MSVREAEKTEEVVSLADSQMLRWIDMLNGETEADASAAKIKNEIRLLWKEPNSAKNRREIKKLYDELEAAKFRPDYLCLIIDREKDYHRACKGFRVNGIRYVRLLGTTGGIKNSTIVFVSDRLHDELMRRINNGRDRNLEIVPAKLEAYQALTCSASIPVSMPNGILVVKDVETVFRDNAIYLNDECEGEPSMEIQNDIEIVMDASDGFGLMLPSLAERWSEELELGYTMCGCNTRFN